jgi:hypothetical protein
MFAWAGCATRFSVALHPKVTATLRKSKKKPANLAIAGLNPIQEELEETGELYRSPVPSSALLLQ